MLMKLLMEVVLEACVDELVVDGRRKEAGAKSTYERRQG